MADFLARTTGWHTSLQTQRESKTSFSQVSKTWDSQKFLRSQKWRGNLFKLSYALWRWNNQRDPRVVWSLHRRDRAAAISNFLYPKTQHTDSLNNAKAVHLHRRGDPNLGSLPDQTRQLYARCSRLRLLAARSPGTIASSTTRLFESAVHDPRTDSRPPRRLRR